MEIKQDPTISELETLHLSPDMVLGKTPEDFLKSLQGNAGPMVFKLIENPVYTMLVTTDNVSETKKGGPTGIMTMYIWQKSRFSQEAFTGLYGSINDALSLISQSKVPVNRYIVFSGAKGAGDRDAAIETDSSARNIQNPLGKFATDLTKQRILVVLSPDTPMMLKLAVNLVAGPAKVSKTQASNAATIPTLIKADTVGGMIRRPVEV